jgi:uncharacterized protein (TIGR02594 family)
MQDLLIEFLKHYGTKEILGSTNNPEIVAMFHEIGYDSVKDDEVSWCSAAMNYFAMKTGYERSGQLDARSWLKMPIMVLKPELGDVVILWRDTPDSWKGHVGLYIASDVKDVYILGGNQGNGSINISAYPRDRVLGYRKLKKLKP